MTCYIHCIVGDYCYLAIICVIRCCKYRNITFGNLLYRVLHLLVRAIYDVYLNAEKYSVSATIFEENRLFSLDKSKLRTSNMLYLSTDLGLVLRKVLYLRWRSLVIRHKIRKTTTHIYPTRRKQMLKD